MNIIKEKSGMLGNELRYLVYLDEKIPDNFKIVTIIPKHKIKNR